MESFGNGQELAERDQVRASPERPAVGPVEAPLADGAKPKRLSGAQRRKAEAEAAGPASPPGTIPVHLAPADKELLRQLAQRLVMPQGLVLHAALLKLEKATRAKKVATPAERAEQLGSE